MKSRMEKYYNNNQEFVGRSERNEQLYRKKDYDVYSTNETVIDTSNEIDITKIKDIIKSREDYQRAKSYRNMLSDKKFEDSIEHEIPAYEEKEYDINTILEKAKEENDNKEETEKVRKLKNTQYDILNSLDVKSKEQKSLENQKEELKDLINTITHKEDDSGLGLFDELKAENTLVTKSVKELEEELTRETLKAQQLAQQKEVTENLFFDSFTFSKKDFEDLKNLETSVISNNKLIKVLIFILVVVILTVTLFVLNSFFDFLPFI